MQVKKINFVKGIKTYQTLHCYGLMLNNENIFETNITENAQFVPMKYAYITHTLKVKFTIAYYLSEQK